MKIVDYRENMDKKGIVNEAYAVCQRACFPVEYQDVYEHLFGNEDSILKLLYNDDNKLAGFGVFLEYKLELERKVASMLYLSGMVIDKQYQGKNISHKILKVTYDSLRCEIVSLRTQNIKMAKALLGLYREYLLTIPGDNKVNLDILRQASPFAMVNDNGVICNCYGNQLYSDLDAINDNFGIKLGETDALAVVVEPKIEDKKLAVLRN